MKEISKMSKKERKEYYASQRVLNGFNTGTRSMKTDKTPTRARKKVLDRRTMREYN